MKNPVKEYRWLTLPAAPSKAITLVTEKWKGTPYQDGSRVRGMGVDCVNLITALLDDLYQSPQPTQIPRLPSGISLHNTRAAYRTIIALRHAFPSVVVRDDTIEPGDMIVVRAIPDPQGPRMPGHVMMAGNTPGTLFHVTRTSRACWTGIEGLAGVLKTYRPLHKDLWGSR